MMYCPNCGKQKLNQRILMKDDGRKQVKYFICDECQSKFFIRKITGMIM